MSYSLNSLKVGYIADYIGDYHRAFKGDTRSLDYSTHMDHSGKLPHLNAAAGPRTSSPQRRERSKESKGRDCS